MITPATVALRARRAATGRSSAAEPVDGAQPRRSRLGPLVSLLVLLVVWELVSLLVGDNKAGEALVPSPIDLVGAAKDLANYWKGGLGVERTDRGGAVTWPGAGLSFLYNSGATGLRMTGGYLIGFSAGVLLAALVSWSTLLRRIIALPAHFARMLPLLALLPLFGLWFGNSERGAVLFIAFTVFVLVFAVSLNAIGNVPRHYEQYARALGAGPIRTYVRVVLPCALPQLRTGITLSLGFAWSAAISAEFNGQQYGLGHIASLAEYFSRTDMLALIALIIVVFAALSYLAAHRLLARITRWAE